MTRRLCDGCLAYFEPRGPWQKICWPCWSARRDADRDRDRARDRDREREAWRAGYQAGLAAARQQALAAANARPGDLDPRLLRRAAALCHPDRHAGREREATEVCGQLLALLAEQRRPAREAA